MRIKAKHKDPEYRKGKMQLATRGVNGARASRPLRSGRPRSGPAAPRPPEGSPHSQGIEVYALLEASVSVRLRMLLVVASCRIGMSLWAANDSGIDSLWQARIRSGVYTLQMEGRS